MGADLYRSDHPSQDPAWIAESSAFYEKIKGLPRDSPEAKRLSDEHMAGISRVYDVENTETYFRDSYNDSSLFWVLDLSWWSDVPGYFGPNGDGMVEECSDDDEDCDPATLYKPGLERLRKEVIQRTEIMERKFTETDKYDEEAKSYFRLKAKRFIAFLNGAIAGNHTIYCSI